jgi:septal ring factor EnvC (AmiA/AmiB activator)
MILIFLMTVAVLVFNVIIFKKLGEAFELLLNKFIVQNQEFYKLQAEQLRVLNDDIIQFEKNIRLMYSNAMTFSRDMKGVHNTFGKTITDLNTSTKSNITSGKIISDVVKQLKANHNQKSK